MYNWNTETALNALDPIKSFTPDQINKLEYFAKIEPQGSNGPAPLRRRLAGGLLKLAILLDGPAQAALLEAQGRGPSLRGKLSA